MEKLILYFYMSKDKTGFNPEFESLEKEIFGSYVSPDIYTALRHYKTGIDFANYVLNSDLVLFPLNRGYKSESEIQDFMEYNAKRK